MYLGVLVFDVTDYIAPKMVPHYGAICAGEPCSDAEREMCLGLGLRLAEWASFYADKHEEDHPSMALYNRATQHEFVGLDPKYKKSPNAFALRPEIYNQWVLAAHCIHHTGFDHDNRI